MFELGMNMYQGVAPGWLMLCTRNSGSPMLQGSRNFCTWKHPRLTLRGAVGSLKHANVVLPSPSKVHAVFAKYMFALEN